MPTTSFQLLPIGVGDAFSANYYSACMLLAYEGKRILIDCPHPIRKALHDATATTEMPTDLDAIDAIVLTHVHADHSSGLEGFAYFARFVLQRRVQLYAHPKVSERLWENSLAAGMDSLTMPDGPDQPMTFEDYFELHALSDEEATAVGPFSVECRWTKHPVPTTALRIATKSGALGYSSDTAWDPDLIEWLATADRIIHECNFGIHTPYERLIELPEDVRAKMWIHHLPDSFDRAASLIEPLEQGRLYTINRSV